MIFVKTFKGYEDKIASLDTAVNTWIMDHEVDVVDVKTTLSHEQESRAKTGDLVYTILYKADKVVVAETNSTVL